MDPLDALPDEVLLALFEALLDPDAEPLSTGGDLRERLRARNAGTYAADRDECATRRVDLDRPADEDPGPLPMEEGQAGDGVVWLTFAS